MDALRKVTFSYDAKCDLHWSVIFIRERPLIIINKVLFNFCWHFIFIIFISTFHVFDIRFLVLMMNEE